VTHLLDGFQLKPGSHIRRGFSMHYRLAKHIRIQPLAWLCFSLSMVRTATPDFTHPLARIMDMDSGFFMARKSTVGFILNSAKKCVRFCDLCLFLLLFIYLQLCYPVVVFSLCPPAEGAEHQVVEALQNCWVFCVQHWRYALVWLFLAYIRLSNR